jgi:hypothetical protein
MKALPGSDPFALCRAIFTPFNRPCAASDDRKRLNHDLEIPGILAKIPLPMPEDVFSARGRSEASSQARKKTMLHRLCVGAPWRGKWVVCDLEVTRISQRIIIESRRKP